MASKAMHRMQSPGEERANAISHGVGALLALAGAAPLVARGIMTGSAKTAFSMAAYGVSLVLLYTASAVYHAVRNPEIKRVLRVMDHCSIFVLILGTYIPMSLLVVGGQTGWMLFLTNTTLAVIGITLNAIDLKRFDKVSLALYALMGWLVAAAMGPSSPPCPRWGWACWWRGAWPTRRGSSSTNPRDGICTLSGTCLCWRAAFSSMCALPCTASERTKNASLSGTGPRGPSFFVSPGIFSDEPS